MSVDWLRSHIVDPEGEDAIRERRHDAAVAEVAAAFLRGGGSGSGRVEMGGVLAGRAGWYPTSGFSCR